MRIEGTVHTATTEMPCQRSNACVALHPASNGAIRRNKTSNNFLHFSFLFKIPNGDKTLGDPQKTNIYLTEMAAVLPPFFTFPIDKGLEIWYNIM